MIAAYVLPSGLSRVEHVEDLGEMCVKAIVPSINFINYRPAWSKTFRYSGVLISCCEFADASSDF